MMTTLPGATPVMANRASMTNMAKMANMANMTNRTNRTNRTGNRTGIAPRGCAHG